MQLDEAALILLFSVSFNFFFLKVYAQNCIQAENALGESNHPKNSASVCPPQQQQREAGHCWSKLTASGEAQYR